MSVLWVALIRGVNVGGKNKLPMGHLRKSLEEAEYCRKAATYLASGNVVLESGPSDARKLAGKLQSLIEQEFGFAPHVICLKKNDFLKVLSSNPYPDASDKGLHFFFLDEKPKKPNLETLEEAAEESESFELLSSVFYLHAPDGIGRSKLAAKVEKALGVPATARNFRTVKKLAEMLEEW